MFECAPPLIFLSTQAFPLHRLHHLCYLSQTSSYPFYLIFVLFTSPVFGVAANAFIPACAQILLIICCWYETAVFSKSALISLFLIIAHKIFITITPPLQAALLRSLQWVSDRYVSLQEIICCYGRLRGYGETPSDTIFAFLTLNTPRSAHNKIFGAKFLSFERAAIVC